jgi:MFS family permease
MFLGNGVSPLELSFLFIIWASVGFLLEVPSGALADAFSRKWLVIFSGLLKSLAFLTWYFWQDFWGYALGFVLWGVGSTFRSGAFEALLYETLRHWDLGPRFAFHYSRIRALSTLAVLLGEASGGLLITYGYDVVLLVSAAIPVIVTLPFVVYVTDVPKTQDESSNSYITSALKEARGNPKLLMILFISTFLLTVHGIFDEYVPPLFREHGFSLAMIAYLAVPVFAAQALGEYLADRVPHLSFRQQVGFIALGTLCLIPAALFKDWQAVVALVLFFFVFGLASTVIETQLQNTIQGSARATVTSIVGLGDSIGAILWFLMFGLAAEATSITGATLTLVITTLLICWLTSRSQFSRQF